LFKNVLLEPKEVCAVAKYPKEIIKSKLNRNL